MATEVSSLPNGNYGTHQNYAGTEPNGYSYSNGNSTATPANTTSTQQSQADLSKDEVGWYFVEQYYTTLSRNPEKLYLFYNKRSQFVSGQETDKVPVCVGQRAINDKIKELDFHDCKVRVTNVDSQSSDSNIVIQVIGEISNRSQPHKKFTQTFVLATQTNGYFVLNDIFRYLVDEEDEQEADVATNVTDEAGADETAGRLEPTHTTAQPDAIPADSSSSAKAEIDADAVNEKIESKLADQVVPTPTANGTSEADSKAAEEPTPAVTVSEAKEVDEPKAATPAPAAAAVTPAVEKPKTPEPTRAASPAKQQAAQPAAPPKPAAPKTWANLAASAIATPNAPAVPALPRAAPANAAKPTKPAAPAASTPTAPAAAAQAPSAPAAASAPSAPSASRQDTATPESQDEWTAVGGSHHRQQSRQVNAAQGEPQANRGYIKNVREEVTQEELKAALEKFGELAYLDIARHRNCAFVDFKTAEGFNKALNTAFEVAGDRLFVIERRFPQQRGQFQGGARGNRGGANGGASRGDFQANRGNAGGRGGRGGASGQRGRGQA